MSICLIVSLAFRGSELSLPIVVVVKDSIHNCRLHRSGIKAHLMVEHPRR